MPSAYWTASGDGTGAVNAAVKLPPHAMVIRSRVQRTAGSGSMTVRVSLIDKIAPTEPRPAGWIAEPADGTLAAAVDQLNVPYQKSSITFDGTVDSDTPSNVTLTQGQGLIICELQTGSGAWTAEGVIDYVDGRAPQSFPSAGAGGGGGGGGGGGSAQVEQTTYNTAQSNTAIPIPSWAKYYSLFLVAGGGGGGSGHASGSGSPGGGAGGGSGSQFRSSGPLIDMGSNLYLTVGDGGNGGAGVASGNGNAGSPGSPTFVATENGATVGQTGYMLGHTGNVTQAGGGSGGLLGGSASSGVAGAAAVDTQSLYARMGLYQSNVGSNGAQGSIGGGNSITGPSASSLTSGGAGGGAGFGYAGGNQNASFHFPARSGGAGGWPSPNDGGDGADGTATGTGGFIGQGGAGGGGGSGTGIGGDGGDGVAGGGGGGGGGAQTGTSGAGGKGGVGLAIITFFGEA